MKEEESKERKYLRKGLLERVKEKVFETKRKDVFEKEKGRNRKIKSINEIEKEREGENQ